MNEEHQENLRDLAAMFALNALIQRPEISLVSSDVRTDVCVSAYKWADSLMSAKDELAGIGIASVKRKRK
jgi:hypothetical protein|tara:strand:- start:179 stop:388 length:210 start_codon:yes stop_codon:yes gene_type:complete